MSGFVDMSSENDPASATAPQPQGDMRPPQRVLACVLCQQRKIKCDRKFPCANCLKSRAQCVPAAQLPRRRKRRFAERELLDQLRRYEDLLQKNNVDYEPLSKPVAGEKPPDDEGDEEGYEQERSGGKEPSGKESFRQMWHTLRQDYYDFGVDSETEESSHDNVSRAVVQQAWDKANPNDDHLLFGSSHHTLNLSALHPSPANSFKLWQLFLDNVNPLLKVVHAQTVQGRLVGAISDMANAGPTMEALLFSIYCTATLSIGEGESMAWFGESKDNLLAKYQFGCQQALLNAGFLRSGERDCLTAMYLYLVSVSGRTDPRALCSMLGLALRIAQRLQIHSEAALSKLPILEAEMRRRLWWALVLLDHRISQLADYRTQSLVPTWDCKVPLNLNDADLRPEMKQVPKESGIMSEAAFARMRAEIGDFMRNAMIHLDFLAPELKPLARKVHHGEGNELETLSRMMEEKFVKNCDPENPVQFMTIWTCRADIAKSQLMESYAIPQPSQSSQEQQILNGIQFAVRFLEADTAMESSPLTKNFHWFTMLYFPFPGYIHIAKGLKAHPLLFQKDASYADKAWEVMSQNCEARFTTTFDGRGAYLTVFSRLIFGAWEAREAIAKDDGEELVIPRIVTQLRAAVEKQERQDAQTVGTQRTDPGLGFGAGMPVMPSMMPMMSFGSSIIAGTMVDPSMAGPMPMDMNMGQTDWSTMDWGTGQPGGW